MIENRITGLPETRYALSDLTSTQRDTVKRMVADLMSLLLPLLNGLPLWLRILARVVLTALQSWANT